jgi:hypothetical protein
MQRNLILIAAWTAFTLIAFVTLAPIGLRPETGSAILERFAAYGILGAVFVAAYPRRFTSVMLFILAAAVHSNYSSTLHQIGTVISSTR